MVEMLFGVSDWWHVELEPWDLGPWAHGLMDLGLWELADGLRTLGPGLGTWTLGPWAWGLEPQSLGPSAWCQGPRLRIRAWPTVW